MYSDAPLPHRSPPPTFYFDYQSLLVFNSHYCHDSGRIEADLVGKDKYHSDARIFFGADGGGDDPGGSDGISFHAKRLFITGPTHDSGAQGELVIEHHVSSSSSSSPHMSLFLCIPLGLTGYDGHSSENSCDIDLIIRNATANKVPNISDLSLKHAISSNDRASFSVVAASSSASSVVSSSYPFHHDVKTDDVIIIVAHKQLIISSDLKNSQLPILHKHLHTTISSSREPTTLTAAPATSTTSIATTTPPLSSARVVSVASVTEGMEGGDDPTTRDGGPDDSQQLGSSALSAIMSLCGCTLIAFLFLSVQYAIRNDAHHNTNNSVFVTVVVIFLWSLILCGNFVCGGLYNHLQLNYWLAAIFGFLATSCTFFFFFNRSNTKTTRHIIQTYFCMRWIALLSVVCVLVYCNLLLLDPSTAAFIELGVGLSSVAFMIADAQTLLPSLLPPA